MASTNPQKRGISFSIDSILSSTSSSEKKPQPLDMYPSNPYTMPLPVTLPIMPLSLPEYPDLRTEDQLSECSDASDKTAPVRGPSPDVSLPDSSINSQDSSIDTEHRTSFNRRKKSRTAFSTNQIDCLEKRYSEQRYLSVSERSDLAMELELSDQQVKTWFQNRRMKEKRQRRNPEKATRGIPHLQPADAINTSGAYVPIPITSPAQYPSPMMNQSAARDFMTLPRSHVLPHVPMYPGLYSNPAGYYPMASAQMRVPY